MNCFVIETKEFVSHKQGWEKVSKTSIEAKNITEALEIVDSRFRGKQYSHEAISEKNKTVDCTIHSYF
ncbi:hypothetical protein [Enterococcus raffinosus]|jgi:hypothetical protein|uniref:hypothetical protein n=1 Tax=Enterococcus raffinosus TaxID=71452 RepID=UPI003ACB8B3F